MNSWVEHVHKAGMTSDTVTLSWLLRVAIAFGTTQLPVQSLRQRGLRLGGLSAWSGMLGSFDLDYEQQQIALGALCALLESDEAIEMFTQETSWYDMLVRALPALVHESSESLSVPDILFDTLHLSCVIVYHPMFSHAPNDGWLWERVLEQSARVVQYEPGAALHWACLAAALADKHEVAVAMLKNPQVKRTLVHLAEEIIDGGGGGGGSGGVAAVGDDMVLGEAKEGAAARHWLERHWWDSEADSADLERAYAQLALSRLSTSAEAHHATASLSTDEKEEISEPFIATYASYTPPPLPPRPPSHLLAPLEEQLLALSLVSVLTCAVGGLVWGTLAGAVASARKKRPIWRSALVTAAAAATFEALMQVKVYAMARARVVGTSHPAAMPPPYTGLLGLTTSTCLDIALSSAALLAFVQPGRAPLTFGGWILGRIVSEVGVDFEVVD